MQASKFSGSLRIPYGHYYDPTLLSFQPSAMHKPPQKFPLIWSLLCFYDSCLAVNRFILHETKLTTIFLITCAGVVQTGGCGRSTWASDPFDTAAACHCGLTWSWGIMKCFLVQLVLGCKIESQLLPRMATSVILHMVGRLGVKICWPEADFESNSLAPKGNCNCAFNKAILPYYPILPYSVDLAEMASPPSCRK